MTELRIRSNGNGVSERKERGRAHRGSGEWLGDEWRERLAARSTHAGLLLVLDAITSTSNKEPNCRQGWTA